MSGLRDFLKRHAPGPARAALARLRGVLGPAPIETQVLRDYQFAPDPDAGPRLNLVVPGLDPASAFGGVTTCVEFLLRLGPLLRDAGPGGTPVGLRLLTERADPLEATVVPAVARAAGQSLSGVTLVPAAPGSRIATGRGDVFIAYNWWTSLNIQPVLAAQAAHFGVARLPKIHFLQDYEPQFYEFSSAHLLARLAFDLDWPLWTIVNSVELKAYFDRMGHRAARAHVFEPRLAPALRPFAADLAAATKRRRILAYARPQIPRNCYTLVARTLELWSETPESQGWEVVSAGAAHPPLPLAGGRRLEPLGKLSLEAYGALLRETAVGLSLMSSPHPSYPPIEMAHFGVRTLTSGYADKALGNRHANIVCQNDVRPASLAATLAALCAAFDRDPAIGLAGHAPTPGFLDGGFDCLDALAADLRGLWRAS